MYIYITHQWTLRLFPYPIIKHAAINTGVHIAFCVVFTYSSDEPKMGLLDHMALPMSSNYC